MRAITKTTISYGLQNIPCKICTLVRDSSTSLSNSCPDNKCQGDVGTKNYCKKCNNEVAYADIIKAYKLSKDSKVIIDKNRLKEIYDKENTIQVLKKLPRSAIDVSLVEGSYYILPDKLTKVWGILQRGLAQSNNVILCTYSIRGRTRLGILTTKNDTIVLLSMAYHEQLVSNDEKIDVSLSEKEVELGKNFIDDLPEGKFEDVKDSFKERFEALITNKDPIVIPEPIEEDSTSFFTQEIEVKKK